MKELIKYALPGGCVQRDTREIRRANRNIKKRNFYSSTPMQSKGIIDANGFEWVIENNKLTLKGGLMLMPNNPTKDSGVLSFSR